jgi:UDP-glucose 4-epimerase
MQMGQAFRPEHASRPTLVVGGAGFIGAQVVEALLARGCEVRVLDDLSGGRATALPLHDPSLELRIGDMLDPESVAEAMEGMRWCVHLAAMPARAGQDAYEVALSNILGFINVLDGAQQHRVDRLVYASSAAIYGDAGDRPLAEDHAPRPLGPQGMEKLVMEGYAELYARQHALP